jgi:hypothetical protein
MRKGVFTDMTGVISNSNPERPDRALGAARPWLDPRISMHVSEVIFLFLFILFNLSIPIF